MIYPNKPLYLLSLLGYIYYLTYYTLTTKDNIKPPFSNHLQNFLKYTNACTTHTNNRRHTLVAHRWQRIHKRPKYGR